MASVVSNPDVTLNIIGSSAPVGLAEQKVLVVGQKTAAGSAVAGSLQESILDVADINARFGKRSHVAQMLRAMRLINRETQFDAIALDDSGTATPATGSVAFTGTATAAGRLTLRVMSNRNRVYTYDVASGETATDVAAAFNALIAADDTAPFTSAAVTGTLTFTAANGGTLYNGELIKLEGAVAGLSAVLAAFAGGGNDPSLTGLFDVINGIRYQTIVWPGAYVDTPLKTLLNNRFNVSNDVLDGVGIITRTTTLATHKTNLSALNSQSVVYFANRPVAKADFVGSHLREIGDVVSAQFAALRSLRLTPNANLANVVVTTSGPLDQFGGLSLATLPYFNTPFQYLDVPVAGTFWSDIERGELEESGGTVIGPNRARTGVVLDDVYTTYTTDPAGNADTSFRFLNTIDASSVGREYRFQNYKRRFAQSRLTNGDLIAGRAIENEASIRAYDLSLYGDLADAAIYQAGDAALAHYDRTLDVKLKLTPGEGSATINSQPKLVGQFRAAFGTIQIDF